jgi:dTDP-4-amino-4,6-dideoxygalactose transaminase
VETIPNVELKSQWRAIRDELQQAIDGVFERSVFITGPNLEAFEAEFASYCGRRFGVGVGSGTDALAIALQAAGVGAGDEVITVPNSVYPTARAITMAGARPMFADIDPATNNLHADGLAAVWTERTRAVLPVHLYGFPADMRAILAFADRRGALVIEDACQAAGSRLEGCRAGSFGMASCFSFYPSKNLGGYGDGGMIVTDDQDLADRARRIRWFGQTTRDHFQGTGRNSRLDELQAAMLRVKLRHLDTWNACRARLAARYDERLTGLVTLPPRREGYDSNFHLYVVKTGRRDELRSFLERQGIGTQIHYRVPLHLVEPLRHLGYQAGDFPAAERNARTILSLPMYPELAPGAVDRVGDAVRSFLRGKDL